MPDVTALIPLKALSRAKGRLADALPDTAREALVVALAERVLTACQRARHVGRILLVAGDEAAAAVGRRAGVDVVVVARPGLAAALAAGERCLEGGGASLVLPADLPDITTAAVEQVCRAGSHGPVVVVAPTRDGGTSALLRRPATIVPTAFGPQSAVAHVRLGVGRGLDTVWLPVPELARDLDRPADLVGWVPPRERVRSRTSRTGRGAMPQGTIKSFDPHTSAGSLVDDRGEEYPYSAETFGASGLVELRLGQRVRFDLEGEGDDMRVSNLQIVSL